MSEINFGFGESREFLPNYAGVAWQEAWENNNPDYEQPPVWAECIDELGEFCEQLNQTNCVFYINDTNSDFDCIVVMDHRDKGGDWWFSREQLGDEEFEDLYDNIGDEVMVVHTKYPPQTIAEYVMRIIMRDIDQS